MKIKSRILPLSFAITLTMVAGQAHADLANFNSYGGSEAELRSMITRCNKAGVKIYADAVFNNWASYNGGGTGTGGSSWSPANYPRFRGNDFHAECSIGSYGDRYQVQNCRLNGMPDLNTGSNYVQNEVATYMKTLVDWGGGCSIFCVSRS